MERTRTNEPLSSQMKRRVLPQPVKREMKYDGDFGKVISTGSTLLDLNISGGRVHGGGIPGGIFVEVFGPSGSGKTVLLTEIAGDVQRKGGDVRFDDPEARLNAQFALMFGFKIRDENYAVPDKVTEVFEAVRKWKPKPARSNAINGIFTDSLAALSTAMEMDNDDGDPFGGRRAKEFSEGLRKTCRLIKDKNYIMVCSNQVREVIGATKYQEKTKSPGGKALEFYPSLRLRFNTPSKMKLEKNIVGTKRERIIGVETKIDVFKSSIWKPFRSADVSIIFDYGIDDIRQNLQYIKDYTDAKAYTLERQPLSNDMKKAIHMIEKDNLEDQLKEQVINLWEEVENQFSTHRKSKRR